MLNLNKHKKTKPRATLIFKNCTCVCIIVQNCRTNTAQNSSNNFPSYPPVTHHCSDDVYWREGGQTSFTLLGTIVLLSIVI